MIAGLDTTFAFSEVFGACFFYIFSMLLYYC